MAPPPAKKRRLAASAAAAAGVATRRTTTRSQKPRLSAELLARVASYSSLGRDLLGLCVVAGPEDCALIRHAYLRNNIGYLKESLGSSPDWETCRDRYRAWMAVNTDWRKQVTDENMEDFERAVADIGLEGRARVEENPLIPLCNPAVAIELRLQEALVYLVEKKGIDVNSDQWGNYGMRARTRYHLLAVCIKCQNIEAFRYLLGRKDIDIHSRCITTDDAYTIMEATLVQALRRNGYADFFREALAHLSFDIVSSFACDRHSGSPLHFAIYILEDADLLVGFKANFRLLLSAGADPYMVDEGRDAIQYAKMMLRKHPQSQKLRAAVEILEDWVAIK